MAAYSAADTLRRNHSLRGAGGILGPGIIAIGLGLVEPDGLADD